MSKKLLIIVNAPEFFLSHRLPIALAAQESGWVVHVATMPGEQVPLIKDKGLMHHTLPLSRSGMNPLVEFRAFWAIFRLMRRLKPDVAHLVTIKPVLYGGLAARLARVPGVVAAVSGLGYIFLAKGFIAKSRQYLVSMFYRVALGGKNTRVIFQNPNDRDILAKLADVRPAQVEMIYGSGVDLSEFVKLPEPDGVPVIVMAARLLHDKGVEKFVEAARLLRDKGVAAQFQLIGVPDPGNPASVSEAELECWREEGCVLLKGYCSNIADLFAAANVVVLPSSYREGMPKVLLEAAASGRAVVTTDIPGCRDAIVPGKTGVLVPVYDTYALAQAIQRLIEDVDLRREMGREGRLLAEREFSIDKVVAAHLKIYQDLVGAPGLVSPKLVFFVTEDWYFCSHRLPLALAAKEAGFEVSIITRVRSHREEIEGAGLKLIPLNLSRHSINPLSAIKLIGRLVSIYRSERPDIVHHVAMKPVLYGAIAANIAKVPRIVNALTGFGFLFTSGALKARVVRPLVMLFFRFLLYRPRSRLILQNPDDVHLMCDNHILKRDHISLIRGSGVNIEKFTVQPEADGQPLVILASRMLWDKGVGEFVKAAEVLLRQGINARFVLVGEGDPGNPSTIPDKILHQWHKEGAVEWWGRSDDMLSVFRQSHIVCLPSYREGLPKVLIEAAACGRPIVATDVPGCREIVKNNINGYLASLRDASSLAKALRKLIESPEMRSKMGRCGRRLVEKEFLQEKINSETLALYKELV